VPWGAVREALADALHTDENQRRSESGSALAAGEKNRAGGGNKIPAQKTTQQVDWGIEENTATENQSEPRGPKKTSVEEFGSGKTRHKYESETGNKIKMGKWICSGKVQRKRTLHGAHKQETKNPIKTRKRDAGDGKIDCRNGNSHQQK
jgi:hypothetical protein